MKTIIITGSSGFVGQNLSKYLSDSSFLISSISLRNLEWENDFKGEAVVHLAGKAHDTKKNKYSIGIF